MAHMNAIKLSVFLSVMVFVFAIVKPYIFTPEELDADQMIAAETVILDQQKLVVLETEKAIVFFRDGDSKNILQEIRKATKSLAPSRIEKMPDGSLIIRTDGEIIEVTSVNDMIQIEKL